jgi:hypothetical protein
MQASRCALLGPQQMATCLVVWLHLPVVRGHVPEWFFATRHASSHAIPAGVQGMDPVTQTERTFVWTLITEITAVCNGGPSVDFMLTAWRKVSTHIYAQLGNGRTAHQSGLHEEAAAILRALAISVDLLGLENVCHSPSPTQALSALVC